MLEAAFWGLVAASALVIGAAVGIWVPISRRIVALIMAFGAGALISALAFDLTEEAFAQGGTGPVALGLALGGLTFFVGDLLIERGLGGSSGGDANNGPALVLGALLDGLPESVVLGASLIGGLGVSVSFLAAVFASNFPEGLGGRARPARRRPIAGPDHSPVGGRRAGLGGRRRDRLRRARRHAARAGGDHPGVRGWRDPRDAGGHASCPRPSGTAASASDWRRSSASRSRSSCRRLMAEA